MNESNRIIATKVPAGDRLGFFPGDESHPGLFGARHMLRGSTLVYNWMGRLCQRYNGGYWEFYTLSNGGSYMVPAGIEKMRIEVDEGNGFDGEMSADAAGIVATLFALGQLASETEEDLISERYHLLRDFALEHAESNLILRAID